MRIESLRLTIAGAPISVNKLYYNKGSRARVLTDEGARYKRRVKTLAIQAMSDQNFTTTELPVSVNVRFYFKTRSGDADNCLKALLDSLSGLVWKDDRQVADNTSGLYTEGIRFRLIVEKHKDKSDPRTEIVIRKINQL